MNPIRDASVIAALTFGLSLAPWAAEVEKEPLPENPAVRQPNPEKPAVDPETDYSKEQLKAVKPPAEASMGAVEKKPADPAPDPIPPRAPDKR
ncbi:MAG: hypothetical protein ABI794_09000 [Betaproteobacteria bacterium]